MIKYLIRMAALAIALAPVSASAEWLEATSPHFIVYADTSKDKLADYAERLEIYDSALRLMTQHPDTGASSRNRVTVYVLPNISDVRAMAHNNSIGGYYSPSVQGSFAFMPLTANTYNVNASAIMFHEYAHHMLMSSSTEVYPRWVNEGMAEFFMTAKIKRNGDITFGAPEEGRFYSLAAFNPMSATELIESADKELSSIEVSQLYARGWLLIHYLLLSGDRPGQLTKYIDGINNGLSSYDAAKAAFGDLDKLNHDLNAYSRGSIKLFTIPHNKLHPGKVSVKAMSPGAAAIMPLRMRSAAGVTEKTAPELVGPAEAIAAQYPNDAFVQRALAEMEYDAKNDDKAMAAADRALAIDPKMVMAMVYKGRVYGRRGVAAKDEATKTQLLGQARSWFIKANHVDPDYALPLELYYDSYTAEGKDPPKSAVAGLMRAIQLVPQVPNLRAKVAVELVNEDQMKLARQVLAPVAFAPHSPVDNPARKVLDMIDAKKPKADILAAMKKDKWQAPDDF